LILRKILKIIATTCHILRLKRTKFDIGWGGELRAFPKPPSWIWGPTSKERGGRGRERKESKRGKGNWRGSEGEGRL